MPAGTHHRCVTIAKPRVATKPRLPPPEFRRTRVVWIGSGHASCGACMNNRSSPCKREAETAQRSGAAAKDGLGHRKGRACEISQRGGLLVRSRRQRHLGLDLALDCLAHAPLVGCVLPLL